MVTIYTCIIDGYDTLQQPYLPADGFEFICFVRKGSMKLERVGAWKIVELPYDWDDRVLLSRSPKMNPHSLLPEDSEWSLWIDGNVRIKDDSLYRICRDLVSRDVKYAGIRHPFTDCPYEEAEKCLKDRREKFFSLLRLVRVLRKNGVPEHSGLTENNIIFRKHNDEAVVNFDRWWWECFIRYTRRDQLVHTLCLRDTPELETEDLLPEGISSRNFEGVELIRHPAPQLNWIQRKLKYGLNKPEGFILHQYIRLTRPGK